MEVPFTPEVQKMANSQGATLIVLKRKDKDSETTQKSSSEKQESSSEKTKAEEKQYALLCEKIKFE